MKHLPKYCGLVFQAPPGTCYCKRKNGAVWTWVPRVTGNLHRAMNAHVRCFHRLFSGEN